MCLSLIIHALQPINVLDFVDQVVGEFFDAFDRQDVVRRRVTFDNIVALFDQVAVLQMDVLALGDQIFRGLLILDDRLDDDATLVLVVLAEPDGAGDLGDGRGLFRPSRFEQLGHPRETAGDVAGLGAFGRNARDDVARLHVRARIDGDDGVDRKLVTRFATTCDLGHLAALVLDHHRRPQIGLVAAEPCANR